MTSRLPAAVADVRYDAVPVRAYPAIMPMPVMPIVFGQDTPGPYPQSAVPARNGQPPSGSCSACSRDAAAPTVCVTVGSSTTNAVPLAAIVCGELDALSERIRFADRRPAAVGEKTNVNAQLVPGARPDAASGQVVCTWKSPPPIVNAAAGAAPLNAEKITAPVPALVTCTVALNALDVPTSCFAAKWTLADPSVRIAVVEAFTC